MKPRHPQFSLLSLLLCTSFAGALGGVFVLREKWYEKRSVRVPCHIGRVDTSNGGQVTPDGRYVFLVGIKPPSMKAVAYIDITGFDLVSGSQVATLVDLKGISAISISPDGDRIAYCTMVGVGYGIRVCVWDWRREEVIKTIDSETPNNIAFAPDGRYLLLSNPPDRRPYPQLWLIPLGDIEPFKSAGLPFRPILAYYSLDGQSILALEANAPEHRAFLLDAKTLTGHPIPNIHVVGEIVSLAGGRDAVQFDQKKQLVRFDLETGTVKWRVPTIRPDGLGTLTISPDNTRLAYHDELALRIADLETGATLAITMKGLTGQRPRFLANGDLLAFEEPKDGSVGVHIFTRRYPEWWWGHFHRVEVWLALVFGIAVLVQLVRWWRSSPRNS